MKNRVWILLLAAGMLLALCACGSKTGGTAEGESYEILDTGVGGESSSQTAEKGKQKKPDETAPAGESATAASAAPASSDVSSAPDGYVDVVKYNKVVLGMPYEDVKTVMGSGGEKVSSTELNGDAMTTYQWQTQDDTGTVAVTFKNGKVCSKMGMNVGKTEPVATREKADKIRTGMTYEEVKAIFGVDGVITYMDADEDFGYEYMEYMWNGAGDTLVQVIFSDGKVSLVTDSGLT